ncbi:hypothetical protein [Streptomyces chartreusis]|uniref:hypothetical protein n=1 Tax=Streptomyces chartreusis TaxID=1969 RepID=UPI0033DDDD35
MDIRAVEPSRTFITTEAGAGLNFDHPCGHGNPSISLHLFSEQEDATEDIAVILPACAATALFGAAIANIEAVHGSEAAEDFVADMIAAKQEAAAAIADRLARLKAAEQACCQAGALTQGREHTCRSSDDSRS